MSFHGLWAAERDTSAAEEENHSKGRRLVHCLEQWSQNPWAVPRLWKEGWSGPSILVFMAK